MARLNRKSCLCSAAHGSACKKWMGIEYCLENDLFERWTHVAPPTKYALGAILYQKNAT